jgi:hypothetical protein
MEAFVGNKKAVASLCRADPEGAADRTADR